MGVYLRKVDNMRINWFSNASWVCTGYGNQTRLVTPRIKAAGYPISVTALHGLHGQPITSEGIMTYPAGRQQFSQDVIGAAAIFDKADIIISLFDIWVMQPEGIPPEISWYPWFPVDHEPMPRIVAHKARMARKPITMSKFGQKMCENIGLESFYIPHAVDTKIFKRVDRTEARKRLQWPEDKFIVGMVAANKGVPPRKSFFEIITGFAALHKAHPDTMLYLHTDDGVGVMDAVNIKSFCDVLGLKVGYQTDEPVCADVDVLFSDKYTYLLGLPDPFMVDMYNSLDVLVLASMGEGFGIPLIEAQACGTPVIVGDWTSMGELCFSGWKIPKTEARATWSIYAESWQWLVNPEAVAARLMAAYEVKGNEDYRDRARQGALHYDIDKVFEKYWKPTLATIEEQISNSKSKMEMVIF